MVNRLWEEKDEQLTVLGWDKFVTSADKKSLADSHHQI
jgi:hypothetical protein